MVLWQHVSRAAVWQHAVLPDRSAGDRAIKSRKGKRKVEGYQLKRYLVFAGDNYYPAGGWQDFIGDFDDLDAALDTARLRGDWSEVVDCTLGRPIATRCRKESYLWGLEEVATGLFVGQEQQEANRRKT